MSTSTAPPLMARLRIRSRSSSRTRRTRTTSTFEERPVSPPPEGCICQRPHNVVFCRSCGWVHKEGRTRLPCPVHVRTIYLLDIECCPKCKSYPPVLCEMVK